MKRLIALTLFTSLTLPAIANTVTATSNPTEGFTTNPLQAKIYQQVTVEAAKLLPDNTRVRLQGNIDQHLRGDHYTFHDKTGTITVEIDHDKWDGQLINPTDTIAIVGEVDRDKNSIKIEVDRVKKL